MSRQALRSAPNAIFTGGVVTENGICSAAFCESAALGVGARSPLGGAVAQRLRGHKWRSEKSVKAIAPTGAALAFLCFDFFFRIVKGEQPLETGCGTQHPLRALGGTRVLLAAAPTTPPCFRRWRRSSSLLLRGGWSPEVGRGESEHPSLPLAQRSVFACLRRAETSPAERDVLFSGSLLVSKENILPHRKRLPAKRQTAFSRRK